MEYGPFQVLPADEQYAANLAYIASRYPDIARDMQRSALCNIHLGLVPSGEVGGQAWDVVTQQYVPLSHPDQPMANSVNDAASVYQRDIKVFCLLGMGLGHLAVALARMLQPWQRLVVFEVDPLIFKAAMYAVDIRPLFSAGDGGPRVDIRVGDGVPLNGVEPWYMGLDVGEKLHMSVPLRLNYTTLYRKSEYDTLTTKCLEMLIFHGVSMATWRQFGPCIGDNDLLNLPEYFLSPGYEHLAGLWQDKPAVCIAAGPSLQQNLRQLYDPAIRARVAIIAAGTMYAFLHGIGLTPDIVTTIDFQRLNWTDQFLHVPLVLDCGLVYLHSTYPQTVRRWPGPRFVAENASNTLNMFRDADQAKRSAAQVQTVAHLNLLVALELGAAPIMLLGQDLSMPPDTHHAPGARAEDRAPNQVPTEAFIDAEDFRGQPVKTRHSFLSMRTVFERIAAAHPGRTILNCSEAGLAIAGIQHVPFAEVLGQVAGMPMPPPLRPTLKEAWQKYVPHIPPAVHSKLQEVRDDVARLEQMARAVIAFALEMGCAGPSTQAWLLERAKIMEQCQRGWELFPIRDFDIIETLGAIPDEDSLSPDVSLRQRAACMRTVRLSRAIARNAPAVQRLLRLAMQRLEVASVRDFGVLRAEWHEPVPHLVFEDIGRGPIQPYSNGKTELAGHATELWPARLLATQLYGLLLPRQEKQCTPAQLTKWLYDTQQYEAAITLSELYGLNPARVARMLAHRAQWKADTLAALPRFFGDAAPLVWDTKEGAFVSPIVQSPA